jgi:hypothetical protein
MELTPDAFMHMVNATKRAMAEAIDEITDGEPEESGKFACFITAELVSQFVAAEGRHGNMARTINACLESEGLPWRMVRSD